MTGFSWIHFISLTNELMIIIKWILIYAPLILNSGRPWLSSTNVLFLILAMRCARNDPEIRHRVVGLLVATGQEKEALRVRLSALLSLENVDPRRVYNQIVKIAEVCSILSLPIFFVFLKSLRKKSHLCHLPYCN